MERCRIYRASSFHLTSIIFSLNIGSAKNNNALSPRLQSTRAKTTEFRIFSPESVFGFDHIIYVSLLSNRPKQSCHFYFFGNVRACFFRVFCPIRNAKVCRNYYDAYAYSWNCLLYIQTSRSAFNRRTDGGGARVIFIRRV